MLVGLLDGDEAAPVYVLRIWSHCQNRRQAQFDLSAEALKALCRFPGNSNRLEASLTASGFIRRAERTAAESSQLIVCGWEDHNAALLASWNNGRKGRGKSKTDEPTGMSTGPPTGESVGIPTPLLSSALSKALEVSKSFNTERVRTAIGEWVKHFENRVGRKYTATKLNSDLMEATRKGWTEEQVFTSIHFSISKDGKSWCDPENDFEKQAKDKANGKSKAGPGQIHNPAAKRVNDF